MEDDTKKETKPTDDLEFLDEVNYSYRKEYHMKKPPYPPHVREYHGDLGREMTTDTFEPSEAHNTQQPPLDIQPTNRYNPHPIEPWVAPKKDHEGYEKEDDSYKLWRDN
jgi:hypothetical protein